MAGSTDSFSIVSTLPDVQTLYTPTETDQLTDDFEVLSIQEESSSWDSVSSCSTSVLSTAYKHEFVHGRRYHGYRSGRYPMPNDIMEQQREDIVHALMMELTDGRLFLAGIGRHPHKIIDIGTGAGTWAIDVADLYPSASVIGTDLSPIQPTWLPVNTRMFVEDCEDHDWLHGSHFDLVHFREIANVLRDLDGVLGKIYPNLRNGGWVEFQELMPHILCDDESMDLSDPLRNFIDFCTEGMKKLGCRAKNPQDLRKALESAGFQDVECIVKKVPISIWPQDKQQRTIGMLMRESLMESLEALAAKPLAALDMSLEERRQLVSLARESLENSRAHRYVLCCFCFGRKG